MPSFTVGVIKPEAYTRHRAVKAALKDFGLEACWWTIKPWT